MHYLYWIHYPNQENPYYHGYIGVSNNPERRLKEHSNYSENNMVFGALKKGAKLSILHKSNNRNEILLLEEKYRPEDNIGWNVTKGGGNPPNSWKTSDRKQHGKNRCASQIKKGTHNFLKQNRVEKLGNEFDSESSKKTQLRMLEEGRHALKGMVNCVDKYGKVLRIPREEYYKRKGELVTTSSKKGKERMNASMVGR